MHHQNSMIPVVRLSVLFDTKADKCDQSSPVVLILEEDGRRMGLMVDKLLGKHQFAVKKLSGGLSHAPGVLGCTIMPDGGVGLILGAGELIRMALRQPAAGMSPVERAAS
jgi:two-component system chemotaxis sensor kinase CheA